MNATDLIDAQKSLFKRFKIYLLQHFRIPAARIMAVNK